MAFLKGNTYIDGDLIVDGDIAVGSLSSKDVAFTQLVNPEDNYIAVTTSAGNLTPSSIRETTDASTGVTKYQLNSVSAVDASGKSLSINSNSVTINTPVDKVTTAPASGNLTWVYKDGTTCLASTSPTGAKPGSSNPIVFPVGVKLA